MYTLASSIYFYGELQHNNGANGGPSKRHDEKKYGASSRSVWRDI